MQDQGFIVSNYRETVGQIWKLQLIQLAIALKFRRGMEGKAMSSSSPGRVIQYAPASTLHARKVLSEIRPVRTASSVRHGLKQITGIRALCDIDE